MRIATLSMRDELRRYCNLYRTCKDCPIDSHFKNRRCGYGALFNTRYKGKYDISDDEIIEMHSFLWPEKAQIPLHNISEEQFLKMLFDT